ncbi:MAG: C39 family peptidase [Eubacteriales bacterium]|nr:C39 family peptidase [Eubacteriales bacterium]
MKVNIKAKNPLFMQWDIRWGYKIYGDDVAGLTACGPTCLSMVAVYLLQDTKYSPDYMIDWADKNGYCVDGGGSLWTLMSEGAEKLGIDSAELPLDKQRVINNLEVGNPVVCIMGPGDFTKKGHFIVMTGIEDGKIKINDPNSFENSNKLWDFDDISSQINNLWAMRV